MLQFALVILLVVLILVGALLPLRYTARMHLPPRAPGPHAPAGSARTPGDRAD